MRSTAKLLILLREGSDEPFCECSHNGEKEQTCAPECCTYSLYRTNIFQGGNLQNFALIFHFVNGLTMTTTLFHNSANYMGRELFQKRFSEELNREEAGLKLY